MWVAVATVAALSASWLPLVPGVSSAGIAGASTDPANPTVMCGSSPAMALGSNAAGSDNYGIVSLPPGATLVFSVTGSITPSNYVGNGRGQYIFTLFSPPDAQNYSSYDYADIGIVWDPGPTYAPLPFSEVTMPNFQPTNMTGQTEAIPFRFNVALGFAGAGIDATLHVHVTGAAGFACPLNGGPVDPSELTSPSNRVPVCSCADPVLLPFGLFRHSWTDFSIPGRGDALHLDHTYSTLLDSSDGPLGFGWDFSYDARVTVDPTTQIATVNEGGGTQAVFNPQGGGYVPKASRTFATLTENVDGTWTFVRQGTDTFTFNSAGQLTQETDPNGYHTNLAYDGNGHLATVTDPAGRALTFTWTGSHVTAVSDPSTPARTIGFAYDASSNLTDYTDVAGGNWHYTFDASHRLLTMRDPRQATANPPAVVTNGYDGQGRVTSQTDQLNRATSFDYTTVPGSVVVTDPKGNQTLTQFSTDNTVTAMTRGYGTASVATWQYTSDMTTAEMLTVTDPNNHTSTFGHDAAGNVIRSIDAQGRPDATAVYNQFNEPVSATDRNGVTTTNVYDATGNLQSTSTPLDGTSTRTTTFNYADTAHPGEVTSVSDPDLKTWAFHYDANGDRDTVTDPLGDQTTTVFNVIGWPLSVVSPRGNVTGGNPAQYTSTFDSYTLFGDLQHTTDPLGHVTQTGYDADRNVTSSTDADNHTTSYVYDAANQPTEIHRPDTTIVTTSYWPDGRMQSQTDAANHSTSYAYDPLGRLSTVTDPLGNVTTHLYDPAGNEIGKQDPGGNCAATPKVNCTSTGYDADNEATSVTYSDGVTPNITAIAYNNNGRRTSAVDSTGTSSWGYDALGRLTSSATPKGGTILYGYDLKGQLTTIAYPNNAGTVTRGYDDAGRLHTVTDWLGHTTTFNHNEDSENTSEVLPNTTTVTNTFDPGGRLITISDAPSTAPNSPYASFTYGRDNANQLTSVTSTGVPTDNRTWTYNSLNQLATDTANTFAYTYDSGDNLTKLNASGSQQFDAANQLCWTGTGTGTCAAPPAGATIYQYDTRGNRVTTTPATGRATTYTYNANNQLTSVSRGTGPILAAGTATTYLIYGNDTLAAFGLNNNGQTGNGTTTSPAPVNPQNAPTLPSVAGVYAARSGSHALAIKPDNTLWSWGLNTSYQLGMTPISTTQQTRPVAVTKTDGTALTNVGTAAAGATSSYAVTSDGGVWAWGANTNKQLGMGATDTTSRKNATEVANLSGVKAIAAGANHVLVLKTDGTVWAWGLNSSGQLGVGVNDTTTRGVPTQVMQSATANGAVTGPLTGVVSIAAGANHSLAIKADGSLFEWGANSNSQLGNNATTSVKTAFALTSITGVIAVAGGVGHTVALKADGTVWAWGLNSSRQLGTGNTTTQKTPVQSKYMGTPINGIITIAAGDNYTFALEGTTGGYPNTLWSWGAGNNGQLGYPGSSANDPGSTVSSYGAGTQPSTTRGGAYTYDTQGLRATKTVSGVSASFSWDVADDLPLLLVDGTTKYVYGPGGLPLEQITGTTVLYYNHDQLGSTRVLTNSTGAVVATYTYDDYGRLAASTGTVSNPFGYAGQYTDPETGLLYMRARYYDAATGQFLNRDPIVSLTRDGYGYASRSPLVHVDPLGLAPWDWVSDALSSAGHWVSDRWSDFKCGWNLVTSWGNEHKVGLVKAVGIVVTVTGVLTLQPQLVWAGSGVVVGSEAIDPRPCRAQRVTVAAIFGIFGGSVAGALEEGAWVPASQLAGGGLIPVGEVITQHPC